MKKIIIIICIFFLTGCSDYREINDLAIVTGISIDYQDELYDITTQLIINDKKSSVEVFETKSTSIDEALAEISKLSNKELFISHLKVLIITENVIKNDIDYYDYFLRNSKSKMNFYTYIIDNDLNENIFNIYKEKNGSSLYLEKMMQFNQDIFSSSTPLKFIDLMYTKLEPGINPIYPVIKIRENNNEKVLYLSNLVSYDKKYNKTTLSENESIFYNILTNQSKHTSFTIDCDNDNFTIDIQNIKTKFKWKDNTFFIKTTANAKLNNYECKYDLNKSKTTKKLNELSTKHFNKNINNLIKTIKTNNNDFIGIGTYIYKHDKNYFNSIDDWDKNIKNINIKIDSSININSSGEIRK